MHRVARSHDHDRGRHTDAGKQIEEERGTDHTLTSPVRRVEFDAFRNLTLPAVTVGEKSKEFVKLVIATGTAARVPNWLTTDHEGLVGKVLSKPSREEIDSPIKEQLIVEYYSR